jgi:hypothetical protein
LVNPVKTHSPTVSLKSHFLCKNVNFIETRRKTKTLLSHGGYSMKMSWNGPLCSIKLIIQGKNLAVFLLHLHFWFLLSLNSLKIQFLSSFFSYCQNCKRNIMFGFYLFIVGKTRDN